jgi:hypothetical protein
MDMGSFGAGGAGLDSLLKGRGGGNGDTKKKKTSLSSPYKSAGIRIVDALIESAIAVAVNDDDASVDVDAGDSDDADEDTKKAAKPVNVSKFLQAEVTDRMFSWLLDVSMKNPQRMSTYGTSKDKGWKSDLKEDSDKYESDKEDSDDAKKSGNDDYGSGAAKENGDKEQEETSTEDKATPADVNEDVGKESSKEKKEKKKKPAKDDSGARRAAKKAAAAARAAREVAAAEDEVDEVIEL